MKKVIAMVMASVMMVSLAACGGSGSAGGSQAASAEASNTVDLSEFGVATPFEAPEDIDYTQGDKVTITMATGAQSGSATVLAMQPFKKMVETVTGGRITVDIHENASLGSTREIYEAMSQGTIDMVVDGTEIAANFNDLIGIFSLPYLFTSDEQIFKFMRDEEATQKYYDAFEGTGFRPLTMFLAGWYVITTKNPIPGVADVGGQKIRSVENDMLLKMLEAVNAVPTPMAYGEVYTGMQQGTIDGQFTLFNMTPLGKFYEVQNYAYLCNSVGAISMIAVSDQCWNSLSESDQKLFKAAAKKCNDYAEYYINNVYYSFVPQMQEENPDFTIVEYTPEEIEVWAEKMRTVYSDYYDRYGKENIDELVNYQ